MNLKIVLDTNILMKTLLKPDILNSEVKNIITQAQNLDQLYISSISLLEIAKLIQLKKLHVYARLADFLNSIVDIKGLNVIQLNPNIIAESILLPQEFADDQVSSIIIASTREIAATLITKEQKIIDLANQGYLKLIAA
jgi:PIN domain nuclease of toxin-antitoxin system